MVEKSHTGGQVPEWWTSAMEPLRGLGQKIADFFTPSAEGAATTGAYEIVVELPGVKPEDIEVRTHDRSIIVQGEKRFEREAEGRTYYFSERAYGAFHRSFRLPEDADLEHVAADYRDGVLMLKVPKSGPDATRGRRIDVKRG
jgi:HSP20 family protein